jgi:adenylate kinase
VVGRCDDDGGQLEQRPDDRPDAVRKRLQVYAEETAPLREDYREQGFLIEIDGSNDPDKVASDTVGSIDESTCE